ncbi:ATP-binding protein [Bacillus cereus group sp. BceL300]|uniref:ATP-binding protein n=1 Tax=Bacillus cereus group TaxID=86661 RepID=UPI002AC3062F|nr:ATP-binding protein [Bacillus cereus]MDZ4520839.1 ATP-binding protein [Bacillus cereus]
MIEGSEPIMYESILLENGQEVQKAYYHKQNLVKYQDNPLIEALPPILEDEEAFDLMIHEPPMDENIQLLTKAERFHAITTVFQFFQPVVRHLELQSRFSRFIRDGYISRNPNNPQNVRLINDCYNNLINNKGFANINDSRSTSSSFVIIGFPGVGKSSGIQRILDLYPRLILHRGPINSIQIVWVKVDCPNDGSLKTLCLDFFMKIDELIGSNYATKFGKRGNTSTMVLQVAMIARNHHIGVLIIDEIQHILAKRVGAQDMLNFFVTLSNEIGIPVIMIGTMRARKIFQNDFRQARRAGGHGDMVWTPVEYGTEWEMLMEQMWRYQWVKNKTSCSEEIRKVLYDASQGIVDIAVKLFVLAQARAIYDGTEQITSELIYQSADEDLKLVKPMLKALREKSERDLLKYEDITPMDIDSYIHKYKPKFDMKQRVKQFSEQQKIQEVKRVGDLESVVASLVSLGFEEERILNEVEKIVEKNPNFQPIQIVQEAIILLQSTNKRKPKTRKHKKTAIVLSDIVSEGRNDTKSAYESLNIAGWIKDPLAELR